MYVGRLLIVGPAVGAYRVSSRSFPNREVVEREGTLTVVPTDDAPATENPYVSYNCLRLVEGGAVLGNGSHVDPTAEKLALGYPARDALAQGLLAMDYEKDEHDTPRIAGVLGAGDRGGGNGDSAGGPGPTGGSYVGIVRRDALLVERVDEPTLVATYERDRPESFVVNATSAAGAARSAYDLDFEHPVCAVGVARAEGGGFEAAVVNGP
ncbi:IMP cyclohydrolase [Halobacteriales archaeon QS_4_69_34]|nr:MAG: IMP cyclohydrolase [Halobacteriales archaeon QS_4_69_34]